MPRNRAGSSESVWRVAHDNVQSAGQAPELGEEAPVVLPAADRALVDRLSNLPGARRNDGAASLLVAEAGIVPLQAAMGHHLPRHRLPVRNHVLIVHLEE